MVSVKWSQLLLIQRVLGESNSSSKRGQIKLYKVSQRGRFQRAIVVVVVVVDSRAVKTNAVAKKKRKKVGTSLLDQCAFFFLSFFLDFSTFYLALGDQLIRSDIVGLLLFLLLFFSHDQKSLTDFRAGFKLFSLFSFFFFSSDIISPHTFTQFSPLSLFPFFSFFPVRQCWSVGRPPFSCPTVLERWTHTHGVHVNERSCFLVS